MKYVLSVLLGCLFLYSNAQQKVVDQRITEYFGQNKVQQWQKTSPDSIGYYTFFLDHSYELYSKEGFNSENKISGTITISTEMLQLMITGKSQFNVFRQNWTWKQDETQWFIVDGTNYYLCLHPISYLSKKFNAGK